MMVNKVVIQSASDDGSTDDVINWLKSLNLNIEIERFFNHIDVETFNLNLTNSKAEITY